MSGKVPYNKRKWQPKHIKKMVRAPKDTKMMKFSSIKFTKAKIKGSNRCKVCLFRPK